MPAFARLPRCKFGWSGFAPWGVTWYGTDVGVPVRELVETYGQTSLKMNKMNKMRYDEIFHYLYLKTMQDVHHSISMAAPSSPDGVFTFTTVTCKWQP